ncbi:hypothetical protein LPJ73_000229 [Coemansia sp. RSA 2703]|nr:hypothetical protein LPJ73_000229 [Coemansia sp. RSA 2703]KAJ2379208.1 hypothetical protein IW150_000317 [Coemansia sp. RSA 2607]KAJ2398300.1 hypothetical protein GGI05_000172 [Coemansia sp. RSA 2603]
MANTHRTYNIAATDTDGNEDRRYTRLSEFRETPLPWGKLSVLLALRLSEPVNFSLILPFVYQMVKRFGVADSPKDISFYASLLFTSFSLFQTIMVMHWGRLSDRIGRKPVIMIGLTGNLVSSVLFGTSRTFVAAMAARSFNGLMAGNVVVAKAVVAEISDNTNRARMMAMIPLMWNLGSIAGSAIGGIFAEPATQYPRWFGNIRVFAEYPYLLPCLIGSSVTLFGLIIGLLKFEETLVKKKTSSSATTLGETTPLVENTAKQQEHTMWQLLTPTVMRVMSTNVVICLALSMADQSYPIFAATDPSDGGLGFSSRKIGISLAIASVAVIYLQLVAYPRLERKYGALGCYRRGQRVMIPYFLLMPFLSLLATSVEYPVASGISSTREIVLWAVLVVLLLVRVVGSVLMLTSINLLTVNMAPTKSDLGFMNGMQQLAMSGMRIFGPLLSGLIWSWSIKHTWPFPFNSHLLWNLCAVLMLVAQQVSSKIPDSVNVFGPGETEDEIRSED